MAGTVTISGSVVKHVHCACGHHYAYVMEREAFGSYSGLALTQAKANERAAANAAPDLARMLATECDPCPCPKCGALTPEMKQKRAQDRAAHTPTALGAVLLGIVVSGIVYLVWQSTGRLYYVIGLFGVGSFVLGLAMLGTGHREQTVEPLPETDARAQPDSELADAAAGHPSVGF